MTAKDGDRAKTRNTLASNGNRVCSAPSGPRHPGNTNLWPSRQFQAKPIHVDPGIEREAVWVLSPALRLQNILEDAFLSHSSQTFARVINAASRSVTIMPDVTKQEDTADIDDNLIADGHALSSTAAQFESAQIFGHFSSWPTFLLDSRCCAIINDTHVEVATG